MKDWALILGASSGIGAECAIELAKKGVNIFGIYLRKPKDHIEKLIKQIKSTGVQVIYRKINAANEISRQQIMDELKKIDNLNIKILLHSLAFGALKPMISNNTKNTLNQKNIEMTLDVMCNSLVYWSQDILKNNFFNKGSQILAMTSSGSKQQWTSYGAVSMAKAALESASRQLALELAPYNIACNTIQAGVTVTPALEKIPGYQKMVDYSIKINPHKRLTTPRDIARVVILVGLSQNYWLTGNNIKVDGGESLTS